MSVGRRRGDVCSVCVCVCVCVCVHMRARVVFCDVEGERETSVRGAKLARALASILARGLS
jgi:hypothetical protein